MKKELGSTYQVTDIDKQNRKVEFDTVLRPSDERWDSAFVEMPFDVESVFGKKRLKVKAWFDGVLYRGLLTRYKTENQVLLVRKDIREAIGKKAGETVHMTIQEDLEERIVEVPDYFSDVLANHEKARQTFEKISFTHRKEIIQYITEAKKEETRANRILKMLKFLEEHFDKKMKKG